MKIRCQIGGRNGFGLVETLVTVAIIGLVAVGASRMISFSLQGSRRVEAKTDLVDSVSRIKNILATEQSCQANLVDVFPTPVEFDPTSKDELDKFNNDETKTVVKVRLGDGSTFGVGSVVGKMTVTTMRLRIVGEIHPTGSGLYDANVGIKMTPSGGGELLGGDIPARAIPIVFTTDPGSKPGLRKIKGCYQRALTGTDICRAIGGRFIDSIQQCYMGGELKLSQYQGLDPKEFADGGALEGAYIKTCTYKYGVRFYEYPCINLKSDYYPKCVYQAGSARAGDDGWVVKYKTWSRPLFNCSAGVTVGVPDPKVTLLDLNESVPDKFFESSGANMTLEDIQKNHDLLHAVTECYWEREPELNKSVRTFTCNQDKAIEGAGGSCVFVNHARAWDVTTQKWNQDYTGWIHVYWPRVELTVGSGENQNVVVREAMGRICYAMKSLNGEEIPLTAPTTTVQDPSNSEISNVLADDVRWKQASECIFLGGTGNSLDPEPPTGSQIPRQGRFVHSYKCDNTKIDRSNLTGDGTGASTRPSLTTGNCWYVSDVNLADRFFTNTNVSKVSNRSGSTAKFAAYTGWVYLSGALADEKFDAAPAGVAEPQYTLVRQKKNGNNPLGEHFKMNAIPCNAGVRFSR